VEVAEIKSAVTARRPESLTLEYKRDLPGGSDAAKSEFLADVCALANAAGGSILYGIGEADGCADSVIGVPKEELDAAKLRLDSIIRSGLEPRLQRFSISALEVDGSMVLEVSVAQSLWRPHWVSARGERRFYIRTSAGKAPMSIDEVRASFNSVGNAVEHATEWRRESISQLNSRDSGLAREDDEIYMALHVCPLMTFAGAAPAMFTARPDKEHSNRLQTVSTQNSNCRSHYLGLITEERDGRGALRERLLIQRDYKIEAIWKAGGRHDPGKIIYASANELWINNWLTHFFAWSGADAYPFPAIAFLTVLNAQNSSIHSAWREQRATGDILELVPAYIEDRGVTPAEVMRATYDHLWQSYGYDACILYDDDGRFDKQRYNPRG